MDWEPITEAEIWDKINESYGRMSPEQQRLWEMIKVVPEKWSQHPYGDLGNGFWVVAIMGNTVIWFNDIEDGFNRSTFGEYNEIQEYRCNQDELEWVIQGLLNQQRDGYDSSFYLGPPQPVA
jgi:hypothetical protein